MTDIWKGFYAAYMTGTDGQGFAMFVFRDGIIAGADPMGVRFDGSYECDEQQTLRGDVKVSVPPEGKVIQGVTTGASGFQYVVPIAFTAADIEKPFIALPTPLGTINLKLEKVREFPE